MRGILLGWVAVLAAQLPAGGAVIRVPEDYPSVLAGVDAAVAGDSVLVGPGTWTDRETRVIPIFGGPMPIESAMFLKPGVTVVGVAGAEVTVLDIEESTGKTIVHYLPGGQAAAVVGLSVTGGGTGVQVSGAGPLQLHGCRIIENVKAGVSARESSLLLADCLVMRNQLGGSGGGAVLGIDVNVTCEGCTFAENNYSPGLYVSMAEDPTMTVVLRDCEFRDHRFRGAVVGDAAVTIERCRFLRNSTPGASGGGLNLTRCSGVLRFSTFAYDSANTAGGVVIFDSHVRAENNTFVGCHANTEAGAMAVGPYDSGVRGNIFVYSTGRRGAVSKTGGPPHPDTGCNLFWANADGDYFGDWVPAPTDLHADPLFCDLPALDFRLDASSPAAPANSPLCGLIGAHEVGCGTVGVEAESWGRIKSLHRR